MASNAPTPAAPASQPQPPATRAVLKNDELLTLIFHEILPWDAFPVDEKAVRAGREQLRRLALCCRAFVEPAAGCLWAVLDSFVPLVRLLPGFQAPATNSHFFELTEDALLFRRARKVRVFRLRPKKPEDPEIPAHIYVLLARETQARNIFPALKSITLHQLHGEDFTDTYPVLPFIFGPTVSAVSFVGPYVSHQTFESYIFPLAAASLAGLRRLEVNALRNASSLNANSLLAMSNLESLKLGRLTTRSLPVETLVSILRTITTLRSITLDIHDDANSTSSPRTSPSTSTGSALGLQLKRLQHVHLVYRQHGPADSPCRCYPRFLKERATELTLSELVYSNDRPQPLKNFLAAIAQESLTLLNLRKVRIETKGCLLTHIASAMFLNSLPLLVEVEEVGPPLPAETPGFEFSFLRRVFPEPKQGVPAPRLTRLALGSCLRLDDLFSVSNIARGLQHLKTRVNPKGPKGETASHYLNRFRRLQGGGTHPSGAKTSLRTLSIGDVRKDPTFDVGDCNVLAELMDLLFPELEEIRPFCEGDVEAAYWRNGWVHVERMRRMYRDLRIHRGY